MRFPTLPPPPPLPPPPATTPNHHHFLPPPGVGRFQEHYNEAEARDICVILLRAVEYIHSQDIV